MDSRDLPEKALQQRWQHFALFSDKALLPRKDCQLKLANYHASL